MPITRKHNFIVDTPIFANEWSDELEQLYSFLSGGISDIVILKQNSANFCLIVQQISSGQVVLELKQGGVSKFQILSNQQFKSLVTAVAPIVVASTTKVIGLNAQYLDGLALASFYLINVKHTENHIDFYFQNAANQLVVAGDKTRAFIVPAGTNMSLTQVHFQSKVETGSDSCTVSLRKNGVVITTANIGSQTQFKADATINTSVAENDIITVTLDGISGTIENLFARVNFKQDLVA